MSHAQQMLQTHPDTVDKSNLDLLAQCIEACFDCAQTCTACADACLGEEMVAELRHCIRLNLDCADNCLATGRMLSRQTRPNWDLLRGQLQVCASACQICGGECESHAGMHEHCRVCAEACRHCEATCDKLLQALR